MEIRTETVIDSGTEDYTFSLKQQKYVFLENNVKYPIGYEFRRAVCPGDIDQVKELVEEDPRARTSGHPIVQVLNSIWTPEVIKAYQEKIKALEEEASENNKNT